MTKHGIVKAMKIISASYPKTPMSVDAAEIWADMLADVADGAALAAIQAHVAREKWPPTIAHIRKAVYHVDLPVVGDAWSECERRIKGEDRPFTVNEISEAYRQIGSPQGRYVKNSEMPFIRKRFEATYAEVCERRQEAENLQRLNAPREAARLGEGVNRG